MLARCAEDRASLAELVDFHLEKSPGFAMNLDCISAALEELEELVEHAIELVPTDPDEPPAIPAWDLPDEIAP
jgi:hypothetical protein